MAERSGDWIRQALRDLESARSQEREGFFEWACFISQQAAEKALKAVFQRLGAEAWGHALLGLVDGLKEQVPVSSDLEESARTLDRYYIPARYPNGWASGTPSEYITRDDARDAIGHSEKILRFCADLLAGPESAGPEHP
jgi:HEPN domain-containing protein